jgi:GTP-binding protein HflX
MGLPHFAITQVLSPQADPETFAVDLAETQQLIDTYGGVIKAILTQQRTHPSPRFYIGDGKMEELKQLCATEDIDVVVVNDMAKSSQLFRIEKELWEISPAIQVWDRIDLILNIFEQHASTVESKLQIELARTTHMGPRIYGLGKTELSRQGGGIGTRGKGETNIEFERRQIKIDQQHIRKKLKKLIKEKKKRLQNRNALGIGPVALVGYTSAGKTSLFNALTTKQKTQSKQLFTTLDTVVGKLQTPDFEQSILLSDTIGFIRNLPPVLIESFKSTLLESLEAKLLLHVIDAADPHALDKIVIVDAILNDLGAHQPRFLVLNKIDLLTDAHQLKESITKLYTQQKTPLPPCIAVSAVSGVGLADLKEVIAGFFSVII